MPLMTLKQILADADQRKYGVGMFNVINLEMLKAIIEAAEEENSPVILGFAEVHKAYMDIETLAPMMVKAAKEAAVPVAVHYDHGQSFEGIVKAMHYGFTSVMYDGSMLPYEQNVRNTQEVVRIAKILDVSVEAELGHVGGAEGELGGQNDPSAFYTDVDQAADFVLRTGIDALAVAIGTAHGVYRSQPKLDLDRLKAIKKRVNIPLVLHGGSGLNDQDFRNAIASGISKINIFTDMSLAAVNTLQGNVCRCDKPNCTGAFSDECLIERDKVGQYHDNSQEAIVQRAVQRVLLQLKEGQSAHNVPELNYPDVITATISGIKAEVKHKIEIFGSNGKACAFSCTHSGGCSCGYQKD